MEITETSFIDESPLEDRQLSLIIGISLNNSYFKYDNLKRLISWASCLERKVYIMIPDEPAVYTLLAFGYEEKEAIRIARLKSNALENKCLSIIKELNQEDFVRIIRWKDITDNQHYLQALSEIKEAYDTDTCFKDAIRRTTASVILSNLSEQPNEAQVEIGTTFLFQELAFISYSALILREKKIGYVYHRTMQVFKEIIECHYAFRSNQSVGFITAE